MGPFKRLHEIRKMCLFCSINRATLTYRLGTALQLCPIQLNVAKLQHQTQPLSKSSDDYGRKPSCFSNVIQLLLFLNGWYCYYQQSKHPSLTRTQAHSMRACICNARQFGWYHLTCIYNCTHFLASSHVCLGLCWTTGAGKSDMTMTYPIRSIYPVLQMMHNNDMAITHSKLLVPGEKSITQVYVYFITLPIERRW